MHNSSRFHINASLNIVVIVSQSVFFCKSSLALKSLSAIEQKMYTVHACQNSATSHGWDITPLACIENNSSLCSGQHLQSCLKRLYHRLTLHALHYPIATAHIG